MWNTLFPAQAARSSYDILYHFLTMQVSNMDYTPVANSTPSAHAEIPSLGISYCWTANHMNFKLQKFLQFICIKVFCSSDLRSAVLHCKSFPVLKPADSLIHTESHPVVPTVFCLYVLLLCLWANFSNILHKESKGSCMWTWIGGMITIATYTQFLFITKIGCFKHMKNSMPILLLQKY